MFACITEDMKIYHPVWLHRTLGTSPCFKSVIAYANFGEQTTTFRTSDSLNVFQSGNGAED